MDVEMGLYPGSLHSPSRQPPHCRIKDSGFRGQDSGVEGRERWAADNSYPLIRPAYPILRTFVYDILIHYARYNIYL
jgi:hypothetical protein